MVCIVSICFKQKANLNHLKECLIIKFFEMLQCLLKTKILDFNRNRITGKAPFLTCADLESVIEKIDQCKNNLKKSSTTKVTEAFQSAFSMSTKSSFKRYRKQA